MERNVAVAILNWNGREHLRTYLPSVVQHSQNAVIYVIDNNSTDDSIAILEREFPSVKVIKNRKNTGFAGGYNEGLRSIKEDYYILLNSDVEVSPNWISPIIELMQKDPSISIAQPKILSYREKNKFEYAGAAGGFIDYLGYPFCRGRIFQEVEEDKGQYNDTTEVFWATGACMFIRSELFWDLGGFDDRYFAHMEEIDLCWRAKNLGHKVYYCGKSEVFHLGGGTINNTNPRKTFLNFRNSLITLKKNDRSGFSSLKILYRLLLDGLAFLKLMVDNGPSHAFAILKAHISFYGFRIKKSKVDHPNKYGIYQGSIVYDHFLKGNKQFHQLKKGFN
jgi:GT2 family glycosyltransferase